MSLINDALKRAREAQPQSPPPAADLQLRPAEPAPTVGNGMGMLVPALVGFLVLIGGFILWHVEQHPAAAKQVTPETKAASFTAPEIKAPVQVAAVPAPNPPAPAPTVAPVFVPPPVPLKLQAVFFAPGHSSAIINGKTVRAGDKFKGFRVAAIAETSATLVSATETNVIVLEQ